MLGFGLFNLAAGFALLLASPIAGALWSAYGPAGTFAGGALLAVVTFAAVNALLGERPQRGKASDAENAG